MLYKATASASEHRSPGPSKPRDLPTNRKQGMDVDEPGVTEPRLGRRTFLRRLGLAGAALPMVGGLIAAACSPGKSSATPGPVEYRTPPPAAPATAASSSPAATSTALSAADQIDADHKKGITDFLANQQSPLTKGKGGQLLTPTIDNGVKVFNLTVDEVDWEVIPGKTEKARAYNKALPGPIIRATEGDTVRINVKNNLTESTTVHWHGMLVPNNMDGVGYLTQDPIKPGGSFTYEFPLRNSGTYMYHSHHNSMDQVNRGLLGAFIIEPKDKAAYPTYDREYILVLNDSLLGFTINGKGFPATDALVAKKGERVLIRFLNEGLMNHPMHLHGTAMQVFAKDGWMLPQPYMSDTIDIAPGNRYDAMVVASEVGVWAFHCHILSHAESPQGFNGLVTALVISA
jgi:FtsP/CotA-like multicopper oxidase with cupredoxin domain